MVKNGGLLQAVHGNARGFIQILMLGIMRTTGRTSGSQNS